MSETKVGQLVTQEAERDAIHIAVMPLVAASEIPTGHHVELTADGKGMPSLINKRTAKTVGVVDPFLEGWVEKGQTFWLFLYPGTITSLKHHWTHPAFPFALPPALAEHLAKKSQKEESVAWLTIFAEAVGVTYESLIGAVPEWVHGIDGKCVKGERIDGVEGFDLPSKFWHHYMLATGHHVKEEDQGTYFMCSC